MNISKKIAENATRKKSEGFISPDDKKYMESKPNRIEVANYVNSLMENHYMPLITNYIQMSSMVLQAILLQKGICTGDEIKEITEKFVEENQRRIKDSQSIQKIHNPNNKDVYEGMENGLVKRIDVILADFNGEAWKGELSEDEKKSIYTTIYESFIDLVNINVNKNDGELMKAIETELPKLVESLTNLQNSISDGTITIKTISNKLLLKNLIDDLIERFNKGLFVETENSEE